jgi:hypothetical protein
MPIFATYSDLKSEIVERIGRAALASKADTFISLAEAKLNRSLKSIKKETETSFTLAQGADQITLPADFVSVIHVSIVISNVRIEMTQIDVPDAMKWQIVTGIPQFYAIDATSIQFDFTANQAYTIWLRYFQKLALSDASPTNWLLTDHPDLYLSASLVEAYKYMRNLEAASAFQGEMDRLTAEILNSDLSSRKLQPARLEFQTLGTFNIYRG